MILEDGERISSSAESQLPGLVDTVGEDVSNSSRVKSCFSESVVTVAPSECETRSSGNEGAELIFLEATNAPKLGAYDTAAALEPGSSEIQNSAINTLAEISNDNFGLSNQSDNRTYSPPSSSSQISNSSKSSSSSDSSDNEDNDTSDEGGSISSGDDQSSTSDEDSDAGRPQQGGREEQESYRKFSFDKEVFHAIHKILANDPTATSLSLLPEADRALVSCDWDTSTLLTHRHSNRPLTRRELLNHVARQMEYQQPHFGVPTGSQMILEALAKPPLFLKELHLHCPLVANRLGFGEGDGVLKRFLSTSTSLTDFTLFHTSTGLGQDNNPPHSRVIPSLVAAVSESSSIRNVALRKLILPADTDGARLLRDTGSLSHLELAYCVLHPGLCQSLKIGLLQNSTLEKFTIYKDLGDSTPSLVPIWEGLEQHKNIREVVTEMMTCHQSELDSLGRFVASTPNLDSLSLIVASNCYTPASPRRAQVDIRDVDEELLVRNNFHDISLLNGPDAVSNRTANTSVALASHSNNNLETSNRDAKSINKTSGNDLDATLFFRSLARNKNLRKLRIHPYATLKDEERAWLAVLEETGIESLDLGQGLSIHANPGLVAGVMESLLGHNKRLRYLNLSNAYCHGELSLRQALLVNESQTLTSLHLRNCRLMDSDVEGLADGLRHSANNTLKELDLGSNYIGFHGLNSLARSLSESKNSVESLDLSFNCFGHFSCVLSFALLLESKALKYLDVSCTDMFTDHLSSTEHGVKFSGADFEVAVEQLCKSLARNTSLTRLAADDNGFSDALAIALFSGLRDNRCLKELSLDGNSLRLTTPDCRQSFVEMLAKNKTLVSLSLPRNRGITEAGFKSLTSGLKRNSHLKDVAIRVLSAEDLPKLQSAILPSRSLVKLKVTMPSVSDRATAENWILCLLKCVAKVKTFQSLEISSWEQHLISPSTGRILLHVLKKNPSFHSFNLSLALCPFKLRIMIDFFMELNKRGRRFLDLSLQQPVGLWPHILAPLTAAKSGCAMYLYFFIREHVALHQRSG